MLLSGCCADDGTFLDVWLPSLPASVERVEIRGGEGVWAQERGKATSLSMTGVAD